MAVLGGPLKHNIQRCYQADNHNYELCFRNLASLDTEYYHDNIKLVSNCMVFVAGTHNASRPCAAENH